MKCLLASLLALLFFTNANALTTPKCHVKPKKKVCINDPINDWIFGGLNTLSELDYTKVCMWHKGSKIVFEMEARNPGLSGFSSNPRYYDLYILSPKMGGFIGFDFRWRDIWRRLRTGARHSFRRSAVCLALCSVESDRQLCLPDKRHSWWSL